MLCGKLKNLVSCSHHFLALGDGYTDVFVSGSDCFTGLFVSTVIGNSDYFNGLGFTALINYSSKLVLAVFLFCCLLHCTSWFYT